MAITRKVERQTEKFGGRRMSEVYLEAVLLILDSTTKNGTHYASSGFTEEQLQKDLIGKPVSLMDDTIVGVVDKVWLKENKVMALLKIKQEYSVIEYATPITEVDHNYEMDVGGHVLNINSGKMTGVILCPDHSQEVEKNKVVEK